MTARLAELVLILTADCNLRCRYCYQGARQRRAMEWPVVRAALDALPARTRAPLTVSFSGGEPTLEWETIARAVEHAERRRPGTSNPGRRFDYHLTTNGVLLDTGKMAFLARHDFLVDVSMDGLEAAQDVRGTATFGRLDELLRLWRACHPSHFARRCRVAVTVSRPAVPHLADSIGYLHARGVRDILIQPAMGEAGWTAADVVELDAQLARIEAEAGRHRDRTGGVPLSAFRKPARSRGRRRWGCSAPLGRSLAVDVDGQVYPCVLAARSYQRIEERAAGPRLARLALGDIRDGLAALKASEKAAEESGLFDPKALQHAGERRCATCRARASCLVCPIGRTWGAATDDPHAVPDSLCAFNRLVHQHACRFRTAAGIGGAGPDRVLRWVFSRRPTRGVTT